MIHHHVPDVNDPWLSRPEIEYTGFRGLDSSGKKADRPLGL